MSSIHKTIVLVLFTGCAASQGTQPHDMSQAGHEQAAKTEEAEAAEHGATHEDGKSKCTPSRAGVVCWSSDGEHASKAEQHRELAAKHRAASEALVRAEETQCAGIPEEDRDMSPFAHSADIISVTELKQDSQVGGEYYGPTTDEVVGATVSFRAVPGMTEEWLQRVMDCHSARNASMGFQMPGMEYCPLMVPGTKAVVRSGHGAFNVDLVAEDGERAKEVLARAKALR